MIEILDEVRKIKKIEKIQSEVQNSLSQCIINSCTVQCKIERINDEVNLLKQEHKNSIINRIMRAFHLGKSYKLHQEIKQRLKELENLNVELTDVNSKIEQLQGKYSEFLKPIEESKIKNYFRLEDDKFIVTDYNEKCSKSSIPFDEKEKKVLVHCTNFFPKNKTILSNYDGGKVLRKRISYRGIEKDVLFLSHRHEVHFTINARVTNTGAGEGNWDNSNFMIIDNYDIHKSEIESLDSSDSWTKGTSVRLSDGAVVMVRIQDKDNLPISANELSNYNVVYYDGNPKQCLENFLKANEYKIFETDANCPLHYYSTRAKQELVIDNRDKAINFLKYNTYDGKQDILLSEADILMICDIAVSSPGVQLPGIFNVENIKSIMDTLILDEEKYKFLPFANFVVGTGIKPTDNGCYTFKRDEEIVDYLEKIETNSITAEELVDIDLLLKLYSKYFELSKKLDSMSPTQIEQLISQNSQQEINYNQSSEEQKIGGKKL